MSTMAVNDTCCVCNGKFEEGEKAILIAEVSLTKTDYGYFDSYTRKIVRGEECRVRFKGSRRSKKACHVQCLGRAGLPQNIFEIK